MNTRRQFLVKAPLGLATAIAACNRLPGDEGASASVTQAGAASPQAGATARGVMTVPAIARVLEYIP
jgi:hypothetical protein